MAGGVGVGLYPTNPPKQCEYIINHSDAESWSSTLRSAQEILSVGNSAEGENIITLGQCAVGEGKSRQLQIF